MSRVFNCSLSVLLCAIVFGMQASPAEARGFRVGLIPNGNENNCSNCHNNPGGGGVRNLFGEDVNGLVSRGGREEFWTPEFAEEDSDLDGFTNGEELGDVDGDGVPERTVNITLPGSPGDVPQSALGDCNLDTVLDANDLGCVTSIEDRDAVLTMLNTLPGDLDGNGDVAFADFLVLSGNFGKDLPSYADGNINVEGTIDFADFLTLSGNFGQTPGAASSGALSSVPEPHGGLLAIMGALVFLWIRTPRRGATS